MKKSISFRPAAFLLGLFLGLVLSAGAFAQSYTWQNVEIVGGGYVPGIIFNTKQKDLVYARTDIGGAYRLNPTTRRWIPLTDWISYDDWNLTGIVSLATDPVDPNRLYLAAGTYTNSWSPINGAILRSTDQGNTWQRSNLPFKLGGNMPGRNMGERLSIDPNRNSILYLGAPSGNGLWRSTDYGVTWSKVSNFPNAGTYVQDPANEYTADIVGVVWITFDPATGTAGNATRTIYVGVADKGTCIYRSTDAGATWAAVPGQPTGFLPHHGILGSNGLLYITYSDTCGPYDGSKGDVWKYNTATGAWTMISPIPSTSEDDYFGYGGLAVDAQNPNTIMVTSLNSWWPDAIIFRSLDAGATWTRIWDWAGYPERTLRYTQSIAGAPWLDWAAVKTPPEPNIKLGWMIGDIDIDPFNSNRFLYGTGATIYGTDNLLAWDNNQQISITVRAQGLEETAVLSLISPPSGANLISGLGDICGFRHDSLTTVPAKMMTSPTFVSTTCLDYAELTPSFMVRVGNVDKSANSNVNCSGFSYDGGTSWFQGNSEPGTSTNGGTVAAAADASGVVWAPIGIGRVVYSRDNGNTWGNCNGLPGDAKVASDRVNGKKFYGVINGSFYVSTDGGANFSVTATGLPVTAKIKALPGREGDIWLAGAADGLYHSTDSGATFARLTNVQEADTIGFGKAAPGQSYPALYTSAKINNVRGIYRSDDGGSSWVRINDDQHQYGCTNECITGDPRIYGRVYLGTNGRGIIYGDTSTVPTVTPTPTPTPTTSARGDVNDNGVVDINDALLIARYAAGLNPSPFIVANGDVTGDGVVNILDALQIARYAAGLIPSL